MFPCERRDDVLRDAKNRLSQVFVDSRGAAAARRLMCGVFPAAAVLMFLSAAAFAGLIEVTAEEAGVSPSVGASPGDARLHRGAIVSSYDQKNGWYAVNLRNGESGWVPGWLARKAPAGAVAAPAFPAALRIDSAHPLYAVTVVDAAEIRAIPYSNLQAKRDTTRIGRVERGAVVKVTEEIFGWMRVELAPWSSGWVYSEALAPAIPGNGSRRTRVRGAKFDHDEKSLRLEFDLGRAVPYSLAASADPGIAHFVLYGVDCEKLPEDFFTIERMMPGSSLRCDSLAGTVEGGVYTFGAPKGYSGGFSNGVFRLDVRTGWSAIPLVVLDPGHGAPPPVPSGFADGAKSPDGKLKEKDLVVDIAKRVRELLARAGLRAELTREGDSAEMIDLYNRIEFAEKRNADVFVSIHLNGDNIATYSGAEVYWYDPISRSLAEAVAGPLGESTGRKAGISPYASFAVMRSSARPSILIEAAYLSNPKEAKLLGTEDFRRKTAEGIAQGIIKYFSSR